MHNKVQSNTQLLAELSELRQRVAELEGIVATYDQRESALYESESRLHTVLTHAPIILWSINADGIFTFAAGKGLSMVGLTPNQMIGRPIRAVYQDAPQLEVDVGRALAGEIFTSHLPLNGLTFQVRYTPLFDEAEEVAGVTALAVDVTERQLITELLAQSEERHRAAAELTSDYAYAFRVEANGELINEWVTGSFVYITGFTMAELEAQGGWSRLVHPDDMTIAHRRRDAVLSGQARLSEFRIITKDGQVRWIQDHARPVWDEAQGRTVRIYGAALDITDQKLAEQALQKAHADLEKRVASRTAELARANANLRQEIRERQQLQACLTAIYQLGHELTLMHDEATIIDRVLKTATNLLRFDFATYGLVDRSAQLLAYRYRMAEGNMEALDLCLPLNQSQVIRGIGVSVVQSGQGLIVSDTEKEPRYVSPHPDRVTRSALCVPLRVGPRISGVLVAESQRADNFTADDQQLLQTLADQTAVALENARLYTETQRRLEAQTALRQAGAAIFATLNLDTVLNEIATQMGQVIGATSAYIGSYESDTLNSTILAKYIGPEACAAERLSDVGVIYNLRENFSAPAKRFQQGQPWVIYLDDFQTDVEEAAPPQALGARAILIIPLKMRGQVIAYAEIWDSRRRRAFSEDDIALCQDIAQQAVIAIENARLHTETERRAKQLSVLHELDQAITACLHISDVYDAFARHTIRLIAYDYLAIILIENETRRVVYTIDDAATIEWSSPAQASLSAALEWVMTNGRPLLHLDDGQTTAVIETEISPHKNKNIKSMLLLPLRVKGQVIGIWSLACQEADVYNVDDLQIAQSMADQLAIAIDNARLFEAEQMQRRRIEALQAAGAAVSSTLDLNQVLDGLLKELGKVIPYDSAAVFLKEDDRLRMTMAHHVPDFPDEAHIFQPDDLAAVFNRSPRPLIITDVQQNPDYHAGADNQTRGWMGIPLLVRDQFIGYFMLNNRQPAAYTQTDANLALSFANQAAIAVENARLYQNLQKQMQVLQEAQAQLVRSEKMAALGRLSAAIAHEINNPLQAIKNVLLLFREELERGHPNDRLADYLNVTGQEIERISMITNRMRNFYRPLGRELPTMSAPTLATIDEFYRPTPQELQWIDLPEALGAVLHLVDSQLRQHRVTVKRQWAEALPPIEGNNNHLKQVFLNLVLNAIEGMEGQGGTLYLSLMLDQAPLWGGHLLSVVRLEFSDTGHGISSEALPHLFEPFFSTKKQGSGLGLFISHKIIEAHNGQINVESQIGLGTTFSVLLPLEQPGKMVRNDDQQFRS